MKYFSVETIQTFKHRYVVSEEDLQNMNPTMPCEAHWLDDAVTCNDIDEFSQTYIGEQIIGNQVLTENEVLELFDKENDYLSSWTPEQKIKYIKWLTGPANES
jgi:hypothetical protein